MKYFIDTEFLENGPAYPIQLVSIGIVAEDGRELYLELDGFPSGLANDWVKANVLPHLLGHPYSVDRDEVKRAITQFVQGDDAPEFWGYYADYDWVVFAQIFGTMMDLPKGWPMYCRDLKQYCDQLGNPTLPKQASTEHNALHDARWNKTAFEFLRDHVDCALGAER